MKNCRNSFASRRRAWASRVLLCCAFAGLIFNLPVQAGQAARGSHTTAKTAPPRPIVHKTAPPPVELCVVVRNMRGLAVADLRSSDFRLWDNNRLQQISDFSANIVPESVHHVKGPATNRYIAVYFDDLHYDFVQTIRVTDSAYSYFKSILGFGNKVGVFTASGDVTLDFTDDRDKLHQALLAIKPHVPSAREAKACPPLTDFQALMLLYGGDPLALKIALDDMNACSTAKDQEDPPVSSLPVATLRRMTQTIKANARQVITESEAQSQKTLAGLDKLITTVSTLPDPRSIVVASPGFLAGSQARQIDLLARRATRMHIIISTLDTTGLLRQLPLGAEHRGGHVRQRAVRRRTEQLLDVLRDGRPFRLAAEITVDEPAVLEAEIAHAPVGDQLQHAAEQLVLQRGEDGAGGFRVHELGLERAGAAVVHPGQLLHGRVAESQLAALDLLAHVTQHGVDGNDGAAGLGERGGGDDLAALEEQQRDFVRQVGRHVPVHPAVAVDLGEVQQVVEMNERQPRALDFGARAGKRQIGEPDLGFGESDGAGAHGPPLGGERRPRCAMSDIRYPRHRGANGPRPSDIGYRVIDASSPRQDGA